MKLYATIFLFISFALIVVFGFFAMGHAADHGNCIAQTLQGRACTATDVFGVAAYHLSAFQKAGRATLVDLGALATFFAFALLLLSAAVLKFVSGPDVGFQFTGKSFHSAFERPQKISLWRWLSFHENSPNFVIAR